MLEKANHCKNYFKADNNFSCSSNNWLVVAYLQIIYSVGFEFRFSPPYTERVPESGCGWKPAMPECRPASQVRQKMAVDHRTQDQGE